MLYEKLMEYCYKKRVTVKGLEKHCGLANGTIGKWKYRQPSIKALFRVSEATGISINRLCKWYKEDMDVLGMGEEQDS